MRIPFLLLLSTVPVLVGAGPVQTLECSQAKKANLLAAATSDKDSVVVDCSLRLAPGDVVTRQLVFRGMESSGVTLDCNGASLRAAPGRDAGIRLLVTSSPPDPANPAGAWIPAQNIRIERCVIEGSVRVRGMAVNGEDPSLTASSRAEGHTRRVQANAPRGIVFSRNHFIGQGAIPVYFAPGVHDSMILDSRVAGHSRSVAIYLDAESADNTLRGNHISTETTLPSSTTDKVRNTLYAGFLKLSGSENAPSLTGRELIAVDGSARNHILDNAFSNLDNGGIFLYRNCGEGGNIRHQTPNGNEIVNNMFFYDKYDGTLPAIWLASRNGNRSYCDLDKGYPLGSSASDLDLAAGNLVAQNQFYKFEPGRMIRDHGKDNLVLDNIRTSQPIQRKAGCLLKDGAIPAMLADQAVSRTTINPGTPGCLVRTRICQAGVLSARETACAR